jgi:Ser/Thr protein kinase RdoA (MazF antagonist)
MPSQALFDAVRAAYKIEFETEPVDLGGSSTLNLLVTGRSSQWVLRVYRPYVTKERLKALHEIRQALSLAGVPCAGLVATPTGAPRISFDSRQVELEHYIEHDAEMDTWETLEIGLPVLARMHDILRDMVVGEAARHPLFANYIEASQALPCTLRGTRRIRAWNPSPLELALADEADELAQLASNDAFLQQDVLPNHLVHGDFWDNNVFFRNKEVVFVADFDFMGERPRIDDLALTLYFACMEFFEAQVSDSQLGRLRRLLEAYDCATQRPLSSAERAALPLAIARQPLWSIGGWVALLDDESTARVHAEGTAAEVKWGLRVMNEIERWQDEFASGSAA